MAFSLVGTLVVYILSLYFLKSVLDFYFLNWESLGKILLITLISWLPFFIVKHMRKFIYPETTEKLNAFTDN